MKKLVLVLGGVRSGKSRFAEQLTRQMSDRVIYVATAAVTDDEMRHRIAVHQARRPQSWRTLESPYDAGANLRKSLQGVDVVLLDCLSVLVSNIVLRNEPGDDVDVVIAINKVEEMVQAEVDDLLACYRDFSTTLVIVSNEVGHGVVPPYPLGRIYRDMLGLANQRVAREADEVYMLISGIPIELKALSRITTQGDVRNLLDSP